MQVSSNRVSRMSFLVQARTLLLSIFAIPAAAQAAEKRQNGTMSDVDRLVAIEEIKRLKARRDRSLDMKDWATYESLHAPEASSKSEGRETWNSAAELTANIRTRLQNVTALHHSHTPDITFDSPNKANGTWAMEDRLFWNQGNEEHWVHGFGFYYETYERRNGQWLITSRQLKRLYKKHSPGAIFNGQPM